MILFEIFRRNGEWTFNVAVKIVAQFKKMIDWDLFHLKRPLVTHPITDCHRCCFRTSVIERTGAFGRTRPEIIDQNHM
jgi:hypothetical protein